MDSGTPTSRSELGITCTNQWFCGLIFYNHNAHMPRKGKGGHIALSFSIVFSVISGLGLHGYKATCNHDGGAGAMYTC